MSVLQFQNLGKAGKKFSSFIILGATSETRMINYFPEKSHFT
jgi:hypothetical protein